MKDCPFKINLNTVKDLQLRACLINVFSKFLNSKGELILPENLVKFNPETGTIDYNLLPPGLQPTSIDKISTTEPSEYYSYDPDTNVFTFDASKGENININTIDSSISELNLDFSNTKENDKISLVINKPAITKINLVNYGLLIDSIASEDPDLVGPEGVYSVELIALSSGISLVSCYLVSE